MPVGPGIRLGPYEVVSAIGSGGMGEVYRARDSRLGRDVAIKVLPESFANDPDRLARFEREAQLLASLNHPNIATIHGLEESGGVRALVMELVEGPTLADRIADGPVPLDEALPIARQIAEALEAAHERGVVHRDLKPANIKLTSSGQVKVLDFGLAKLSDAGGAGRAGEAGGALSMTPTMTSPAMMTGVGMLLGTAAYMSPEQARGKPVDRRADIWAFGCVLFEMLTGRQAFDSGETVSDAVAAILKNEPDWNALPPDTPPNIRALLRRCLQKDPQKRLPHIGVARIEIDEPPAAATAVPRQRRRLSWPLAVVTIVAMMLIYSALPWLQDEDEFSVQQPIRLDLTAPAETTFVPTSIAVSPDGQWLAFEAQSKLQLRNLVSGETRIVSEIQAIGRHLFWSPDSRSLAFFDNSSLQTVEVDRGAKPRTLATTLPTADGGTWSASGTILLTSGANPIVRISADGRGTAPVTKVATERGEVAHLWPSFLPDGNHFLFFAQNRDPARNAVYLASLGSSTVLPVDGVAGAAQYVAPGLIVFARNGSLVARSFSASDVSDAGDTTTIATDVLVNSGDGGAAFSVSQTGMLVYVPGTDSARRVVAWFDRAGQRIGAVGEPADYVTFRLSPDGRRLAEDRGAFKDRHVWIRDIDRGTSTRLTFGDVVEKAPAWSPDGKLVLFTKDGDETDQGDYLYVTPTDGSGSEKRIVRFKNPSTGRQTAVGRSADWSPDGQSIVAEVGFPSSDLFVFSTSDLLFDRTSETSNTLTTVLNWPSLIHR